MKAKLNAMIDQFNPTEDNYAALANIWNICWPDIPLSAEYFKQIDRKDDPSSRHQRWLVRNQSFEPVGYSSCFVFPESTSGNVYYMHLHVLPEYRLQGYGGALLETLESWLQETNPQLEELITDTYDDRIAEMQFLQNRGFLKNQSYPNWELDLAAFDHAQTLERIRALAKTGIRIATLDKLQQEYSDWQERIWVLDQSLIKDAPEVTPIQAQTFDQFMKNTLQSPTFTPSLWQVAMDGDDWLAENVLQPYQAEPQRLFTVFTGVKPAYRGRGIATTLKMAGFQNAYYAGCKKVTTSNWEHNRSIDSINRRLGFVRKPAEVFFRKKYKG